MLVFRGFISVGWSVKSGALLIPRFEELLVAGLMLVCM